MYKKAIQKIHYWTIPHEANEYRPQAVRHKTLAVYSALLISVKVLIICLASFAFPSAAEFSTITVNRIIELTNEERVAEGLAPLKHNSVLDMSAKLKAEDMLTNDYFAHNSPDGINPWHWFREADYNYTYAGENLAMNFIEAEDAMQAWMNSPTHKENIMSPDYEDIGIAVVVGTIDGYKTTLVVQHFGKTYTAISGETFSSSRPEVAGEEIQEVEKGTEQQQTQPQTSVPAEEETARQQVELKESSNEWLVKVIKYAETFLVVLLVFVILNLILTMIVRVEVQHKPIIIHALLVILLALILIIWKWSFIENIGQIIIK